MYNAVWHSIDHPSGGQLIEGGCLGEAMWLSGGNSMQNVHISIRDLKTATRHAINELPSMLAVALGLLDNGPLLASYRT